jgi:UDP-N-acetylmuramyl pentapeptide phosphotransferase/UDP-N-acetylglucosamine-1-phosphate transferase
MPLLAAGVPLFDTLLAIWWRSVRKMVGSGPAVLGEESGGVMHRDLEHFHHRLLKAGRTQRKVALLLYNAVSISFSESRTSVAS